MKIIRKIAAILLIVGILVPTGIIHFAVSLPSIVKHYEHHNKAHEPIGFFDFLVQHSTEQRHHDSHPEHNDFPVHHNHSSSCCSSFLVFVPVTSPTYEIALPHPEVSKSEKITHIQQFNSAEFASSIWQPPKA